MELETVKVLKRFVDRAERMGKYRLGTAAGFKAALGAVQRAWRNEDPDEFEYLERHLEPILHRHVDQSALTPHSLNTYLQRAGRVIKDWKLYGQDPKAFLEWQTQRVQRSKGGASPANPGTSTLRTLTWSLRPQLSIQLQLPADYNSQDHRRLVKLLELELELLHPASLLDAKEATAKP